MMGDGWAHFHRDLRTEMHREGLIIDVRANGGGHISQLVLEKLAHRVIGWDVIRWLQPESYPLDARRGPLVTLANQNAGSDGDIVTAAIRLLGLGPVVGTRTWGGVIGIDGLPDARRRHRDHRAPVRVLVRRTSAGAWRTTASTRTWRC